MSRAALPLSLVVSAELRAEEAVSPAASPAVSTIVIEVTAPRPQRPSYATTAQSTATREERSISDLPVSVTTVSRAVIEDRDAHRANDVLTLGPGVQYFSGYGGTWDDYTIRGFHVWSAGTFRNGFLSGFSGANAADAVNVERVEILRGPASALYGPGLPGGAINYVSKRPGQAARSSVGVSIGSFNTARAELDSTGPLGSERVLYRLTTALDTTSGYRDFNDWRRYLVNPVVSAQVGDKTWLLVEAQAYGQAYRADPYGVPLLQGRADRLPVARSLAEPSLPLATTSGQLGRVELLHELSRAWSLRVATQTQLGRYEEQSLFPAFLDPDTHALVRVLVNWESRSKDTAFQAALRGKLTTGSVRHELTIGSDLRRETVDYRVGSSDPSVDPYVLDVLDPHHGAPLPAAPLPPGRLDRWDYQAAGVYVSDLVTLRPGLTLLAGGRADTYKQISTTRDVLDSAGEPALTGRVGVVGRVARPLALYASLSNGFWPVLGIQAGGRVLKPEHSLAWEIGQRTNLHGDALTFDAVYFHIDNKNVSVLDPANPNFQVQRGRAESQGVELALTCKLDERVRGMASYAYTHAVVADDPNPAQIGKSLPLSARHAGAAFVDWTVLEGLSLGPGVLFTSERDLVDSAEIPGYVRLDGRIAYRRGRVQSSLLVQNVLDRRYTLSGTSELGVLPGSPRSLQLTTRVQF